MNTEDNKIIEEEKECKETVEEINEMVNNIKAKCPVHKINISIETRGGVIGMYLMTVEDPAKLLKELSDLEDLYDTTWLYFEPRHIMEIAQIMYGCICLLVENNMAKKQDPDMFIKDMLERIKSTQYKDFRATLEDILYHFGYIQHNGRFNNDADRMKNKAYSNLVDIFMNIWFVPYKALDDLAVTAIDEFQKSVNREEIKDE